MTGPVHRPAADRLAVLRPHLDDGVPLTQVAEQAGVPLRTASRWLASYRAGGPAALTRSQRADRGRRKLPADLVTAIEGLALRRPPPRVAHVHRLAVTIAGERGWPAPSYSTVRAIITALDPGLRTLAHRGAVAYRDNYELVLRREAARSNEQWQADHTELDVMILDAAGRPARPWLTVILLEWRQGDVLMIDNLLVAHGRTPFRGDRRVRVAMREPLAATDVMSSQAYEASTALPDPPP